MDNIFDRGCLVQLSTSVWTGKVKFPSAFVQGADPEFITAAKFLVDKESLRPIEEARNAARTWIYNKSLPFPITGVLFIPKDMIEHVDNGLKEFQHQFNNKVMEFIAQYSDYVEQAKEKLGSLFNPLDYPKDIGRKFSFEWQFFELSSPGQAGILSPELYAREKAKFHQTMTEFQQTAMATLRQTFMEMVDRIVDRLRDNKRFRDSTVENLREFIDDFSKLNITDDVELEALVGRCKSVLGGNFSPQDLRDNEALRRTVATQMTEVKEAIIGSLVDKPIRKLQTA